MALFIQIQNEQPVNHPVYDFNLIQAYGTIPQGWAMFNRIEQPDGLITNPFQTAQCTYGLSVETSTVGAFTNGVRRLTIDASGNVYTTSGTLSASRLYATNSTPTSNNELATKSYVDSVLPVAGTIAYYAATTPPTGWLKANGAVLSRTTYANLYAAIGLTWTQPGDGPANFRLPDLRGQFIRGYDDGRGVDTGRGFGTTQAAYAGYNTFSAGLDDGDSQTGAQKSIFNMTINGTLLGDTTSGSTYIYHLGPYDIATNPGDTRPTNVALLACIKY